MQTEKPIYGEIEEILKEVEPPRVALVEQHVDAPVALEEIEESVREALRSVQLPSGTVAIGVGSRGVGGIGPIVAALVQVLKEAGAEPFVVPAMGSHGGSTAEGEGEGVRHPGGGEEGV